MQTSAAHVADVMAAVRRRIQTLNTKPFAATPLDVEIGSPATFHPRTEASQPLVTIFVYRIEFDNAAWVTESGGAQAVRLHVLITAFCNAGAERSESAGSFELRILSHVIRLFMEQPSFGPVRILNAPPQGPAAVLIGTDLMITAQPRALDVEDMNHIWTTQGDTPYRTSLCYMFSFGIVTAAKASDEGPPVIFPVLTDPLAPAPTAPAVHPRLPDLTETPPQQGALVLNTGTAAAPRLATEARFPAGGGDAALPLVAITEEAEPLVLTAEIWGATGWQDATARLGGTAITSLSRVALQGGAPIPPTAVTLEDDGKPAVLRLSARRAVAPETLLMNGITVTMEGT